MVGEGFSTAAAAAGAVPGKAPEPDAAAIPRVASAARRDFIERSLRQTLAGLPPGWIVLLDGSLPDPLGGPPTRVEQVLAHPDRGIAVLDLLPGPVAEDAAARVRALMKTQGWRASHGGLPQVMHLCLPLRALPDLAATLETGFAAAGPTALRRRDWLADLPQLLAAYPLRLVEPGATPRPPPLMRARAPGARTAFLGLAWFWGAVVG
ncbi:hypothetical protein, partial [Paracraurococcus ruber]|uniref:hypothetical protein n=1 Tax=Paracraurococcus ruber TaxID=77675 RepID=UPI00190512FF